jgi:ADP-heptose:LPS heptosyltransferase
MEALKGIEDVSFYSLQVGRAGTSEAAGMIDLTPEFKSLDDTAAFLCALDLVITGDGVISHLSGALDVLTWVLVDVNPHYTWGRQGRETPWYRSVRLYRQRKMRAWASVFEEVRKDLKEATTRPSDQSRSKRQ